MELFSLSSLDVTSIISKFASAILIFIGAAILRRVVFRIISEAVKKVEDNNPDVSAKEQRAHTLGDIARSTVNVVIYLVVGMMVLSQLGLNIAPIITGAGVLGLAIGFGAQTLVKDVVTGFFILLEGQYNKGDLVEIAGSKGKIKEMNLRTTVVRGENNEIYIIPNSQILKVTRLPKVSKK